MLHTGKKQEYKLYVWGIRSEQTDLQICQLIRSFLPPNLKVSRVYASSLTFRWRVCVCQDRQSYDYLLNYGSRFCKNRGIFFEPYLEGEELKIALENTNRRRISVLIPGRWVDDQRMINFFSDRGVTVEKIYPSYKKPRSEKPGGVRHTNKNFSVLLGSPEDARILCEKKDFYLDPENTEYIEIVPFEPPVSRPKIDETLSQKGPTKNQVRNAVSFGGSADFNDQSSPLYISSRKGNRVFRNYQPQEDQFKASSGSDYHRKRAEAAKAESLSPPKLSKPVNRKYHESYSKKRKAGWTKGPGDCSPSNLLFRVSDTRHKQPGPLTLMQLAPPRRPSSIEKSKESSFFDKVLRESR